MLLFKQKCYFYNHYLKSHNYSSRVRVEDKVKLFTLGEYQDQSHYHVFNNIFHHNYVNITHILII